MDEQDWVEVGVFSSEAVARVCASALQADGIPAVVVKDDAGGAYPFLQGRQGVRLMVAPSDRERAEEILSEQEETGPESA